MVMVFITGCTGPTKLNNTEMESWIGADKSELLKYWGSPNEIYAEGENGEEIYVYTKETSVTVQGLSHDITSGKARYNATRKFWIDASGKIVDWEWRGL